MKTTNKEFELKFEERMETLYSDDPEIRYYAWLKSRQRHFAGMLLLKRMDKRLNGEVE